MNIKKIADTIFVAINMATEEIEIQPKDYKKETKTFSFYMSDKDLGSAPRFIRLKNPKTKQVMDFEQYKKDWDGTHEDIYGYWYQTKDKNYKLLLIND